MPYIADRLKVQLEEGLAELVNDLNKSRDLERSLREVITGLILRYVDRAAWAKGRSGVALVLDGLGDDDVEGALNYVITNLLMRTICVELRYIYINRAIAVLELVILRLSGIHIADLGAHHRARTRQGRALATLRCVAFEFYRRIGGPYEDTAIDRNGDIDCYAIYF